MLKRMGLFALAVVAANALISQGQVGRNVDDSTAAKLTGAGPTCAFDNAAKQSNYCCDNVTKAYASVAGTTGNSATTECTTVTTCPTQRYPSLTGCTGS